MNAMNDVLTPRASTSGRRPSRSPSCATTGRVHETMLAGHSERLRRRDPLPVVDMALDLALEQAGVRREELDYIATTGEGEIVAFRTGHFYGMTTHARGGSVPRPGGAGDRRHRRPARPRGPASTSRAKVLGYRMTSQCASGSGQFLENICRYLGVTIAEIGPLSLEADDPETCSSICAVLAETDVINMVSRGISISNILKGIHLSMGGRYFRLLTSAKAEAAALVTGGLAMDVGLVAAMREIAAEQESPIEIRSHEHSVLAGAIGAGSLGCLPRAEAGPRGAGLRGECVRWERTRRRPSCSRSRGARPS